MVGGAAPIIRHQIGSRLAEVVRLFKFKKDAAKAGGITVEQMNSYFSGTSKVPLEVAFGICRSMNVSMDWLVSGDGPMLLSDRKPGIDPGIDEEKWQWASEVLIEWLIEQEIKLNPQKITAMIADFYQFLMSNPNPDDTELSQKLDRLARLSA